MSNKRKSSEGVESAIKKRRAITMKTKVEIIKKIESGEKMTNVAHTYGLNRSTVGTIMKNKERIMRHVKSAVPMHSTIISKRRGKVIDEMEKLLSVWLEDQYQRRMPISLMLIQEKARSLLDDLKAKHGESAANVTFVASHGWFHRFKARSNLNLHTINVRSEAANADIVAAKGFPKTLAEFIKERGYLPQQIFNVAETGLFWKRIPDRTYISKEEKIMPGFKTSKDRLTLLLGGNASGNCKLKPLLVYHAENPRALKNIDKSSLPVVWKANSNAWVTLAIFEDWFFHHLIPEVEKYCNQNKLPFNILLVLNNAPGHPPFLDSYHPNVQVIYFPPNTTSILQPMDQGVISSFKKYYLRRTFRQGVKATEGDSGLTLRQFWKDYNIYKAINNIDASWHEITNTNMNRVWKHLCPQFHSDFHDFEEVEEEANVLKNLVEMSKKLEIVLKEEDFNELLSAHTQELTNEDLMEMESQKLKEDVVEEQTEESKRFKIKMMAEGFSLIKKALSLFESQDSNLERFMKVSTAVHESMSCYKLIYDEKKKSNMQASLDKFFKRAD